MITSIEDGVAVECGTHDQLMMDNGLYHELVTAQSGGDVGSDGMYCMYCVYSVYCVYCMYGMYHVY